MTVNMIRTILQSLHQSYVLFIYIFVCQTRYNSELEYVINRLSHGVLVIALSINPRPLSALKLKLLG